MYANHVDMNVINREFERLNKEKDSLIQKCDELNKELDVYKKAFEKMKDYELKQKVAEFILNN